MTQDQLFNKMKDEIDAIAWREAELRKPLDAELEEFMKPFFEDFNNKTQDQLKKAHDQIAPMKAALDKRVKDITDKANERIQRLVNEFAERRAVIEERFNADPVVKAAHEEMLAATAERRAEHDAKVAAIMAESDAAAKKVKDEYYAAAEQLDKESANDKAA